MWGWTAHGPKALNPRRRCPHACGGGPVIPIIKQVSKWRCPHACGGGPTPRHYRKRLRPLSPRMWGWTVGFPVRYQRAGVVPTHVGVDRRDQLGMCPGNTGCPHACGGGPVYAYDAATCISCPHACGGGPATSQSAPDITRLSPRMWGWTGKDRNLFGAGQVVPTHVGVDRRRT